MHLTGKKEKETREKKKGKREKEKRKRNYLDPMNHILRFNFQLHPAKRTKKRDCETVTRRDRKMTRTVGSDRAGTSRLEPEVATVERTRVPRLDTIRPARRPNPRLSSTRMSTRGSRHRGRICCSKRVICRRRSRGLGTRTPARHPRPPRANRRRIPPQVEV